MIIAHGQKGERMRLIDADELKTAFPARDNSKPVLVACVRATINHMPTIEPERPEIVHCKDCINWSNRHLCEVWSRYGTMETKPDFYCGHGTRLDKWKCKTCILYDCGICDKYGIETKETDSCSQWRGSENIADGTEK